MTLQEIFDLVNYVVNKEQSGDTMTPAQYNVLLKQVNSEYFNEELNRLVLAKTSPIGSDVISHSPLHDFIKSASCVVDSTGAAPLPDDYVHWMGCTCKDSSNRLRPFEVVTPEIADGRRSNILGLISKPFGYISDEAIQGYPYNIQSISLTYLRMPSPGYYDWGQDADTYQVYYLPLGSYLTNEITTNVFELYTSDGTYVKNIYKEGIRSGQLPYNSLTQELEWREHLHTKFVNLILSKAGINLSEPQVTQYAEMMKKEE
jgi:hypothetical protein